MIQVKDRFEFVVWLGKLFPVIVMLGWMTGLALVIKAAMIIFGLVTQ